MPLLPINKGIAGPTLLAEVLLQKYEYHQPMYRQVQQYRHFESALEENKASDKEKQQLLPQHWIKSHPEAAITEVQ